MQDSGASRIAYSTVYTLQARGALYTYSLCLQPRMIHAAGIDSPGLAGSPAIAQEVVRLLCCAGLVLKPNASFDGKRYPLVMPKKRVKGITFGPKGNKLVQDADLQGKVIREQLFMLMVIFVRSWKRNA